MERDEPPRPLREEIATKLQDTRFSAGVGARSRPEEGNVRGTPLHPASTAVLFKGLPLQLRFVGEGGTSGSDVAFPLLFKPLEEDTIEVGDSHFSKFSWTGQDSDFQGIQR
ncbi:hypothetical protein AK812_SmicGene17383 [Symbiodinium microadriaticum]|uniref:Uncharacterized protein n=1 Tax=Symbiodinium microadriaticum TaxID=2951 RepID=A0A1Q9DXW2_SYMMI|nr:hypothetical protein AK812_SmicGene17383 [Symbiodinium microadriaticum]